MSEAEQRPPMTGLDLVPLSLDLDDGSKSELHAGDLCPHCRSAKLDYDGTLNLACPKCGFTLAGCFT